MCVLALGWNAHPRWRLVVAANRDEMHDRPSAPLASWDKRDVIAGRDLKAGGTWLGVSSSGRFAAVTNLRGFGPPDPALRSRGALVTDWLGDSPAAEAVADYNPCHAVLISPTEALLDSNRPALVRRPLPPGVHAISNGPLAPPWRKSVRLGESVRTWLNSTSRSAEPLFDALRDRDPPSSSELDPAAIFLCNSVYGTRCSTVTLVDDTGAGWIGERRFDRTGTVCGETSIAFRWP